MQTEGMKSKPAGLPKSCKVLVLNFSEFGDRKNFNKGIAISE